MSDDSGNALIQAITRYDASAVAAVLEADPTQANARDGDWTTLQVAVLYGYTQCNMRTKPIVERLLATGADTSLNNEDGHTPLSLARRHNRATIAALIERT